MVALHTDDFRREAVRIALTSRLTRRQVATDLGVGLSTLSKWIQRSRIEIFHLLVKSIWQKRMNVCVKENHLALVDKG